MILQEIYQDDPWKMLCGCILLNLTTRTQVDTVRGPLFERYPGPVEMMQADHDELGAIIRPLGLWNRRAITLRRFSADWCDAARMPDGVWPSLEQVQEMYGIGKYATDSYRIWILRERLHPEDVEDKVIKAYLEDRFEVTTTRR